MRLKVRVEGLREIEKALMQLKPATAKTVVRKALTKAAEPIAEDMRSKVRVDQGDLRDSVGVGTKLTRRQRALHKKGSPVEVFAGAGGLAQATTEEFGTLHVSPHPSLRPAWDAGKMPALETVKAELTDEIARRAARAERKAAKAIRAARR